ncbi:MAG: helix-turn-helix domain-containing protein [Deltaproteobacteria bacterium]|nr:helix-turn-helix domain-containing protein [Deltaproteobacteria bacterium]
MESTEFINMRKQLGFTQKQVAQLLVTSLKTVRSYEQGWRTIPQNIERQLMLLTSMQHTSGKTARFCWNVKKCPSARRDQCPAWKLKAGHFCWFINGTICEGETHANWGEKIKICRKCGMFQSEMPPNGE